MKKCNKKIEKESRREEEKSATGFVRRNLDSGNREIEEMNKKRGEERRETMYGRETLETVVRSKRGGGDVKGPKRSFVKRDQRRRDVRTGDA